MMNSSNTLLSAYAIMECILSKTVTWCVQAAPIASHNSGFSAPLPARHHPYRYYTLFIIAPLIEYHSHIPLTSTTPVPPNQTPNSLLVYESISQCHPQPTIQISCPYLFPTYLSRALSPFYKNRPLHPLSLRVVHHRYSCSL